MQMLSCSTSDYDTDLGMFGVKVFQERRLVQGLMRSMVTQGTNHGYGFDQELLASLFWPTVKDDAVTLILKINELQSTKFEVIQQMIHDSYHCEKDWNSLPVMPYPTQRDPVTKASHSAPRCLILV
jgi:hypothetical protein